MCVCVCYKEKYVYRKRFASRFRVGYLYQYIQREKGENTEVEKGRHYIYRPNDTDSQVK